MLGSNTWPRWQPTYAQEGVEYLIARLPPGYAALYTEGSDPQTSDLSVKEGATLTLHSIPQKLQDEFEITETETVEREVAQTWERDLLIFKNGKREFLVHFANQGVKVTINNPKETEEA